MGQLLITVEDDSFKIDSLRAVFFVGDLLIKRDVARLRRMAPRAQIINMYGSTETQRSVGYWVVPSDEVPSPFSLPPLHLPLTRVVCRVCVCGACGEMGRRCDR